MYICMNCKREVESAEQLLTCPHCGYKIFLKKRPPVAKNVDAT